MRALLIASALIASLGGALAQSNYPNKPVRIVVRSRPAREMICSDA